MPPLADRIKKLEKEHWALGLVLLLGLIHGLIYVLMVPPWQHYDEPGHFEYAWLVANRGHIPAAGEYDQAMRREVAASMVEYNFFNGMNTRPNLLSPVEPIWIGINQTGDQPLYYLLAALPLRMIRYTDITLQVYFARLVSLLLYLVSLVAAYGIAVELTPPGHTLRWLLPLSMALLPGYTDLMMAVNNDAGAAAFFSLFLWIAVATIRRGLSWLRFFGLALTVAACLLTKSTVFIALPLACLALLFSLLRGAWRRIAWALFGLAVVSVFLVMMRWGDAAFWLRAVPQAAPTRLSTRIAPLGSHAFQLLATPGAPNPQIIQLLSEQENERLRGRTVTLGAWIWASRDASVNAPSLLGVDQAHSQVVQVGQKPAFYAFTFKIGKDERRLYVALAPFTQVQEHEVTVFYDGVVLEEGERPLNQPPDFTGAEGASGTWGGRTFSNLVRNASAEAAWPSLRPWADKSLAKIFPLQPSLALGSLLDPSPAFWYFRVTARYLFQTYWGRFGWGHVRLIGRPAYYVLAAATGLGLLGAGISLIRLRRRVPWDALALLGTVLVLAWSSTILRGINSLIGTVFIPSARYAYPVIIPTMLLLAGGWLEVARLGRTHLRIPGWVFIGIFGLFFIGLDLLSIASIIRFYY